MNVNVNENEMQQDETGVETPDGLNRRQFLGGVGGATVGTLAGGLTGVAVAVGTAAPAAAHDESIGEGATDRRNRAFQIRHDAAIVEKQLGAVDHHTNGDEAAFANRIGNFHKTLPHNTTTGEVDPAAYNALLGAITAGDFAGFASVPGNGQLLNPLGALAFNIDGPDSAAITVAPAPSITSPELAAEMAELYWQALCRDIPFYDAAGNDNWASNPTVLAACADLNQFLAIGAYKGPVDPLTNDVTPRVIFRMDSPGMFDGPMVSQFLLRNYVYDGVTIVQRAAVSAPGQDFMTEWNEFVTVQNGQGVGALPPLDATVRYARNMRDLGMVAALDRIYTQYFKAAHIAQNFANFFTGTGMDAAWPYNATLRHGGFATFGLAHLWEAIGAVGHMERVTWYQKWNVHRFLRPEAFSGLVHQVAANGASYPLHSSLFTMSTVLPQVFAANQARNTARGLGAVGSYLLGQVLRTGSPNHPSYPAGHGYTAGACITLMKAFYDETRPWVAPVTPEIPTADGIVKVPYTGPTLTLGGELNKLAHNLSHGRDMSGVHWRSDSRRGLEQGEEFAIRWLREQNATYAEPFAGFTVTRFDGTVEHIA